MKNSRLLRKIKSIKNAINLENWTLLLIVGGLPIVAYTYADFRLAFAVFVIANISLGVMSIRKSK